MSKTKQVRTVTIGKDVEYVTMPKGAKAVGATLRVSGRVEMHWEVDPRRPEVLHEAFIVERDQSFDPSNVQYVASVGAGLHLQHVYVGKEFENE